MTGGKRVRRIIHKHTLAKSLAGGGVIWRHYRIIGIMLNLLYNENNDIAISGVSMSHMKAFSKALGVLTYPTK